MFHEFILFYISGITSTKMNSNNYQMNSSNEDSNSKGEIQSQHQNTNPQRYMHGQQYAPIHGGYPNQQVPETYTMQPQNNVMVRATSFFFTFLIFIRFYHPSIYVSIYLPQQKFDENERGD